MIVTLIYNFETMDLLVEKLNKVKHYPNFKSVEVVAGNQMHAAVVATVLKRDHGYDNISLGNSEHSFIVTL